MSIPGHPRKINIAVKTGEAHESCGPSLKKIDHADSHNRMKTKSLENMGKTRLSLLPA
jgi:hypothetical protein